MQLISRCVWLCLLLLALAACSGVDPLDKGEAEISFLAFGDSGYHTDFIPDHKRDRARDLKEFNDYYWRAWQRRGNDPLRYRPPPAYQLPGTAQYVAASGAQPVADAMAEFCRSRRCDFALMLGDNIYPSGAEGNEGDERLFRQIFERPYSAIGNEDFKIWAALGNHDWIGGWPGRNAQLDYAKRSDTRLTMKDPGFYKFTKRSRGGANDFDAEFFVIDSTMLVEGAKLRSRGMPLTDDVDLKQLRWLQRTLENSTADWKIVLGHHPLWSSGGGKKKSSARMRELLLPILCRHADMYLAGHEHDLEVHTDSCFRELGGVDELPLLVSGAGSKQRSINDSFQFRQRRDNSQYRELWLRGMVWGFSYLQLSENGFRLTLVTTPNSGSGDAVVEKVIEIDRRMRKGD